MFKKLISITSIAIIAFSLTACGGDSSSDTSTEENVDEEIQAFLEKEEETQPERDALKAEAEKSIPDKYKSEYTYSVNVATPSDENVDGYFLNIQLQDPLFTEESVCKDVASQLLYSYKSIDKINKITIRFVNDESQLTGTIKVEDWNNSKNGDLNPDALTFNSVE